ncbi:MAG: hypothetical protein JXO72_04860 [Vicinamibacteria bacterium]|nr:hypothetical protein [Vicinamibacteria bacterium]
MPAANATVRALFAFFITLALNAAFASGADPAKVSVDAIVVTPAIPAPSTLCKLKARVKNSGALAASFFRFSVTIDGKNLPVYKNQTYVVNVEPGTTGDLDLYNFWTPKESKTLDIQVTLEEAQLVQIKKEGSTSTTTPSEPVTGLPASATLSLKMSPAK